MEIEIDLYKVGYFVGKYGTRAARYATMYKVGSKAVRVINKVAKKHKIDSSNVEVVSNNLFNCLEYLD